MSHHLVRGDDDDMEEMNAFGAHDEGDASTGFLSHDADDEDIGLVGGEVGGDHQYSGEGGLLREDSSMSAVNLPFVDLFPSIPKWKRVVVSSSVLFGLSLLFIIAATYNSLATSTNEVEGESSSMEAMMSTMAPMTTAAAALGQAITSSARDTRSYREMTLDNDSSGRRRHAQSTPGLRVVLVSDPTADTAAAAVNVGTGSMDNSQDLRGLAHFLEHMLFMGTEKYPNESEFDEFLSQHGGSYNAYTSDERTVYYFSVDHRYLAGSLDRFAQFFIAPVFSANSTSREVHAVNSEHSKNRQDDNWRGWELLKRAMNPAHPFSWFSTGTLETLWTTPQTQNIDVLQRLHAFHERFYFAENMRLVVLGRESLDQLEMLVRTSFGAMETGKSPIASPLHSHSTPVSLPSRMPHAFTVKPVLERKTLSLSFPTASFEAHDSTRPQDYVSHLIGHEGEGSLLAWLKQRGMATSLSAAAESYTQFGFFTIEIEITDAVATSLDAVDVVVAAVFDYIDTVVSPAPVWVFDENKHMALLSWDYPSKASPISYVQGIVNRMQHHIDEPENLLAPPSRLTFDKSHVDALVASLTPENVVVTVFAENVAGVTYDQLDAFYGTEFAEQMGTMELASRILKWKSRPSATGDFHLPPQPNPFIPSAVSLLSDSSPQLVDTAPHAVVEKPTYRGFHRLDVSFAVPKAQLSMLLVTDVPHASPRYNVLSSLYALLAMDAFGKTSYLGALAGCSDASFGVVRQGLEISVSCYSSGLDAFATQLVNAVRHGYQHLTASSFEALRDATEASLSDAQLAHAYTQAMRVEYETLMSRRFSTGDLLSQVRTVTLNQVVDFATNVLFADVSVDCIFYGNIDASTSMALTHSLAAIIAPTRLVQAPAAQTTVAVPPSGAFLQQRNGNTADTDSAIVVSMIASATTDDVTAIAHLSVLTQLLRQPTFDTLRTKEQLGYIVYGTSVTMGNRMAFEVIVQSALSPLLVRDRVHAFLDTTAPALIAAVTPLTLASTIDILRAQFRMVDLRMSQPSSRIYSEIALRRYTYDRRETIATALDSITVSSLRTFATSLLANRFTIETWGNNTTPVAPASATAVTSHALLFPSPCPCGQVQLMCDGSCVVGSQMGPATPVAACPRWQFFCD